jgi:hypothetical protein
LKGDRKIIPSQPDGVKGGMVVSSRYVINMQEEMVSPNVDTPSGHVPNGGDGSSMMQQQGPDHV